MPAALFFLAIAAAQRPDALPRFSVDGIRLGDPIPADFVDRHCPLRRIRGVAAGREKIATAAGEISIVWTFDDDRGLVSADRLFPAAAYIEVKRRLVDQYGPPTSTATDPLDGSEASATWRTADGDLVVLRSRGRGLDGAAVLLPRK